MEQTPLKFKRPRKGQEQEENLSHVNKQGEENDDGSVENYRLMDSNKKQKSMTDIISFLEGDDEQYDEEEEPENVDISSIITTLQQEISSSPPPQPPPQPFKVSMSNGHFALLNSEEDEREKEMRHLLEASDDELGIPSNDPTVADDGFVVGERAMDGGDEFLRMDGGDEFLGLWEFEDEAAYALMQAELFM